MIKAIIFDYDGVFSDGDFDSYETPAFRKVNTDTDTFIEIEDKYSAMADDSGFLPALREAMKITVTEDEFWNIFNKELPSGLFDELHRFTDYELFILSDQVTTRARHLENIHSFDAFKQVYFSCDIGVCKPEARAFNFILDQHGLKPDECIFVDDWDENITGANSLGFHGVQFKTLKQALTDIEKILES